MKKDLTASRSIVIQSTPEKVWEVLTCPDKIKEYLFGTQVKTDWKVGSPILFEGEYDGQKYKDKGNVIENYQNKTLKYDYWSGFSGLEDKPENYSLVSYEIEKLNDKEVRFTWYQKGFSSKEGQEHTFQGLGGMLEKIKELAQK